MAAGGSKQPAVFLGVGTPERLRDPSDPTNERLGRFGATLRAGAPRGIICISPAWVTPKLRVTNAADAGLARRVIELCLHARVDVGAEDSHVLDERASTALSVLFPEGDVPVVQLSILASGGSEQHLAIGRAIEPLRSEGVLVVGAGAVALGRIGETFLSDASRRFEVWVTDLVTRSGAYARSRGLAKFRDHPELLSVHPSDEHFLPLLVVAGAASADKKPENIGEIVHAGNHGGISTRAFCFRH